MGLRNDICYTLRRIRWDMRYRWCKGESLRETKDPTQSDPKEGDGSPRQSERDERRKSDTAQVRKDPAERTRMELHLLFLMFPRRRKALIALTTNQLVTFTEDLFSLFQLCGTTERQAFFFRNRTKMFRLKGSRNPSSCLPSLRPLFVTCWKPIEESASFFYFFCTLFVASIHTFRVYDTLVPTNCIERKFT